MKLIEREPTPEMIKAQIEWDYVENQGYRELVKEERKEDSKMTANSSPGPRRDKGD